MSTSFVPDELSTWLTIPADKLATHPEARIPLHVVDSMDEVHQIIADEMIAEVRARNAEGLPTRWILPCGPTGQYDYFINQVNAQRISLRDTHIVHMDEFCDWQGRLVSHDHPLSMTGWMLANFYGRIDPPLNVPPSQRYFPDPADVERTAQVLDQIGGIDTCYGGVGYHGHVAFNEPPRSPWHTISVDQYLASNTRVLSLTDDTIIAQSQRSLGGCTEAVPPMAVTIGFADILRAQRIRLFSVTGAWKQTVIRMAAFSPPDTRWPVTLLQVHHDISLLVDKETARPPLGTGNE